MPLVHRNISKKQCAWIRSSLLVGRCCHTLMRAATSHRVFNQRSPSVKRHGKPPTPRSLFSLTSARDRKSTRLNSSHDQISYAVFCLKKKNIHIHSTRV